MIDKNGSLFSQMVQIIDSSIVDLMVTMEPDNPHKADKLQKLSMARSRMVNVASIMDEIYPEENFCDAENMRPSPMCNVHCSRVADCEARFLKRERIMGRIIMAIDESPTVQYLEVRSKLGSRVIIPIKGSMSVPILKSSPTFQVACHTLRTMADAKVFSQWLKEIGVPSADCDGNCAACVLNHTEPSVESTK